MKTATFLGRLTDKPKIENKNNNKLIKFTLAVNQKEQETEYFKFTAWGKMAELVENFGDKGLRVLVNAEPKYIKLENKELVYFQTVFIKFIDLKVKENKKVQDDFNW